MRPDYILIYLTTKYYWNCPPPTLQAGSALVPDRHMVFMSMETYGHEHGDTDTWYSWAWWLAIADSPLPPQRQTEQVTKPQEQRTTEIHPGTPSLQHLHLWPADYRLQKVCICWRPSNNACWWRLGGSGSGVEQGYYNCRWIPLDLKDKAQRYGTWAADSISWYVTSPASGYRKRICCPVWLRPSKRQKLWDR